MEKQILWHVEEGMRIREKQSWRGREGGEERRTGGNDDGCQPWLVVCLMLG